MTLVSTAARGGGAAYTPPTTRELISGFPVTIANTSTVKLTWDSFDGGTALLNLTDAANPSIVTAGIYSVAVVLEGGALTASGYFIARLELDANNADATLSARSPLASAAGTVDVALTMTYYCPAGARVLAQVTNADGVAARDFFIVSAVVQRIT